MDTIDDVDVISKEEIIQAAPVADPISPTPPVQSAKSEIPLYKTERGFNINVVALARDAREDLDRVRIIDVPAPVKTHRISRGSFEAPTLSEVGGGIKNNFCQLVAGKDGRPVSVDDIHYINTDPTRTNINHGTASVGTGNYFSIGWSMKADLVILIYEVIGLSEYTPVIPVIARENQDPPKPVAKLTCQLTGYQIENWKQKFLDVPSHLETLLEVTKLRMRNDTDIPFYMDIFRIVRAVPENENVGIQAASSEFLEYNEHDFQFMTKVMNEIADIRYAQYEALPANTPQNKRKVDVLRLVETLTLGPDGHYIDITLTPIRSDVAMTTFRLRLNQQNFTDEYGRMLIERGLTLNNTSFDRLRIDLEGRRNKLVIVHLTSLR